MEECVTTGEGIGSWLGDLGLGKTGRKNKVLVKHKIELI